MRPLIGGLATLAVLGACTAADVLHVDSTPRPATKGVVPVLLEEPAASYQSIALIEVSSTFAASLDRMAKRLTTEAAKLGGDAVLLTQRSATTTSTLIPVGKSFIPLESADSRLIGKVIVYSR